MLNAKSLKDYANLAGVLALAFVFAPIAHAETMVPLKLNLPPAAFIGTPHDTVDNGNIDKADKPRPPIMVPAGVKNVALGKPVTCSDTNTPASSLTKITDGIKEAGDENVALLRKGVQWVQVDLGGMYNVYAVAVWHAHDEAKVYHSVVIEAADDPNAKTNVHILFNNDHDNTDGLGAGTDHEYFEGREGRLVPAKGIKARYIRFYSKGSTSSRMNEYTEVEVYGRPAQ